MLKNIYKNSVVVTRLKIPSALIAILDVFSSLCKQIVKYTDLFYFILKNSYLDDDYRSIHHRHNHVSVKCNLFSDVVEVYMRFS